LVRTKSESWRLCDPAPPTGKLGSEREAAKHTAIWYTHQIQSELNSMAGVFSMRRPPVGGLGVEPVDVVTCPGLALLVLQTKLNSFEHVCTSIRVEYGITIERYQTHVLMGWGWKLMIKIIYK
jgi:hypothetical protein